MPLLSSTFVFEQKTLLCTRVVVFFCFLFSFRVTERPRNTFPHHPPGLKQRPPPQRRFWREKTSKRPQAWRAPRKREEKRMRGRQEACRLLTGSSILSERGCFEGAPYSQNGVPGGGGMEAEIEMHIGVNNRRPLEMPAESR